jgi:UDP-glucose:(heptosyl)LPS alpha-1,3-glucosyltransferase
MRLAFCLFKYFPYGGLQRDFLRIAQTLLARGHDIHVYTMRWDGDVPQGIHLHLLKTIGWSNHARSIAFAQQVSQELADQQYDVVVGFNKIPNLDLYYAADVCYQARIKQQRHAMYQLLPRYKAWVELEKSVFAPRLKTQIMLISPLQQIEYESCYQTESNRFHLLPPGIAKDRIAPINAADIRNATRHAYQIQPDEKLLLMVGSGFKTKGLDRSLRALAALPQALQTHCRLFVIGHDKPDRFAHLAKKLGIADRVAFLGGRSDVPDFLLAADLLLHPSYHENTGTAILEALVAGLPVLTLDVCGYAGYVTVAQAGHVLSGPFQQAEFNQALEKMLLSHDQQSWRENAIKFAKSHDIYSLPEKAADLIETIGQQRALSQ